MKGKIIKISVKFWNWNLENVLNLKIFWLLIFIYLFKQFPISILENSSRLELEEATRLEKQLLQWEQTTQDELVVNQRIAEKDRIAKQKLIDEQKELVIIKYLDI